MTPNISPEDRAALADELQRRMSRWDPDIPERTKAIVDFLFVNEKDIQEALRAAPAVPREPTEAMLQAGYKSTASWSFIIDQLPDVWRAMYDAGATHG